MMNDDGVGEAMALAAARDAGPNAFTVRQDMLGHHVEVHDHGYCIKHDAAFDRAKGCPQCVHEMVLAAADKLAGKQVHVPKPTNYSKLLEGAPALARQEGGAHYKGMKIQPFEYIHANGLPFAEGCVVKYVSRWRSKGGVEDLKKARHFLDLLIEAEGGAK